VRRPFRVSGLSTDVDALMIPPLQNPVTRPSLSVQGTEICHSEAIMNHTEHGSTIEAGCLSPARLVEENPSYAGSGGCSPENRHMGFVAVDACYSGNAVRGLYRS
jgi:hypothetical protein